MSSGPRAGSGGFGGGGISLGALLLAILLIATVAAFAGTRALRAQDDIVNGVRLEPVASPGAPARIRFRLAEADAEADVLVVDAEGERVRALALGAPLERAKHTFRWDATGEDGEPVAPGVYRLRVLLGEQDRDIQPPGTIRVRKQRGAGA